jgi:putative toxin-antitoxin system antitoxin component (TIGR02293 family)
MKRRKIRSEKLSQSQSARLWKFAKILSKATQVFGSQKKAEEWLQRPAVGLEERRPIDLLATPPGLALVEDYLDRLAYGTYA